MFSFDIPSANSIPLEQRLAAMDEAKNAVKSRKQISKYSVISHCGISVVLFQYHIVPLT